MYYNYRKERIKNLIIIAIILSVAIISTHYIYYKFKDERNIDYNSTSLEIIYHEKTGNKITMNKITPLSDSVGMSQHPYSFTIKNNLTEPVNYKIVIKDDLDAIKEDGCEEKIVSKELLRVSIRDGKTENKVFKLNELEDRVLLDTSLKALEEREFSIHIWASREEEIEKTNFHYHATIEIIEENDSIAMR